LYVSVTNFPGTNNGPARNIDLTCYRNCGAGETQFNFVFRPDSYSNVDNSHRIVSSSGNSIVDQSFIGDFVFDAGNPNNTYLRRSCLLPGSYTFYLEDDPTGNFNDGVCCTFSRGFYELWVGLELSASNLVFSSRATENDPTVQYRFNERAHPFTIRSGGGVIVPAPNATPNPVPLPTTAPTPLPTPQPTPAPTPNPTPAPTPNPTPNPTPQPSPLPVSQPTPAPTPLLTPQPTPMPTPQPTLAPNPVSPQPSNPPPLVSGIVTCPPGAIRIRFLLRTDSYREDAGYMLTNTNTNAAVYEEKVNVANPPFPGGNTLYTRSGCLPPQQSYKFTLFDNWGDGLCCTRGLGYFQLYLDFANELSVEPFWYSWYGAVDGPLVNDGMQYQFPERSEEFSTGTEFGCPAGQVRFGLSFQVDDYPQDTSWTVEEISAPRGSVIRVLDSGGNYPVVPRNVLYPNESTMCLPNGTYRLTFNDSTVYKDGFCCDYQSKTEVPGFYEYSFDGDTFRRRGDGSGFEKDVVEFRVLNRAVTPSIIN
jgi:hypothetical protein